MQTPTAPLWPGSGQLGTLWWAGRLISFTSHICCSPHSWVDWHWLCGIDPVDYKLLGFQWQGKYHYARTLPMGAGSSCAIFERFSTALQFIVETQLKVHRCLHVLDDFLFIAQGEDKCPGDFDTFLTFCKSTGVPIAEDKTHGATQVLEFVGITLHIPLQCSILPDDKVRMCLELLNAVSQKVKVTLKQ